MSDESARAKGRVCARCGVTLKHYALGRLCPNCMLKGGLIEPEPGAASGAAPDPCGTPAAPGSGLPHAFGDYELLELIARGGMGAVYKARQKSLNRLVALKMLLAGQFAEPKFVQRFRSEAEAAAQLQHPNIVAIHEIGEHEGQPFFSMDYVEGKSLAQASAESGARGLEFHRCADWLKSIAEAVHYAHQRGIIHRDLKPSNVLIDSFDRPRITDFGLAKRLTGDSDLTLTGQVLGSPNYIPPEQAEGKPAGVASDVYSLGAILYHLLTGRPPFQAESLTTLLKQVVDTEPIPARLLNPSISRDLETICQKCLEKEPRRRYQTAQELANELGRFLEGKPILARPVHAAGKAWKWCQRRPALAGLSAGLVLTLASGLGVALWQLERTRTSELAAQQNAYAADMNLAQAAVDQGDLGAAMNLLKAHRPAPGQKDFRGWEWRYLWQRCQSDERFELTRSATPLDRLAFSPDSRWLVLGGIDKKTLDFWNLTSRQRVLSVPVWGYLNPFAFSRQGDLLAYATAGTQAVSIIRLESRQEIARLLHTNNVAQLAFSADAARLFTFTDAGTLIDWDILSKRVLRSFSLPLPEDRMLAFSSEAELVAFRLQHGIVLRELSSGRQTQLRLDRTGGSSTALAMSGDGKLLAAAIGSAESEICVWTVEDLWGCADVMPKPRGRFGRHRDWISALAFSPDNSALVSGSADSTLRVWELDHPEKCRRYQGHRHQVLAVAWAPDGKSVVSSGRDGSVRVWDPSAEPKSSGPAIMPVTPLWWACCFSADGKSAIVLEPNVTTNGTGVLTNRVAVLWDATSMRRTEVLKFAGTNIARFAWSADGQLLATGDQSGAVTIWDLPSRQAVAHYAVPSYRVGYLEFSPDGGFLLCGAVHLVSPWDRLPKVWNIREGREIRLPREAIANFIWCHFSPDYRLMVVLHYGGALDLWEIPGGRCLRRFSQPFAGAREEGYVAFSPDGRTCVSSTQWGALALWDLVGKRPPVVVPRTTQELWDLSFSADGTRLLVSGRRSADVVRLFDLGSKRFVATLSGNPDVYWFSRMTADNNTVYAVGERNILLWRAPSWSEIEAAEKKQGSQ